MTIKELKIIFGQLYWMLFSKSYRYNLWKDQSVGFYVRRDNKKLYDDYYEKAAEIIEELNNEI